MNYDFGQSACRACGTNATSAGPGARTTPPCERRCSPMDPMSLMLLVLLGAMLIFMVFNSRKQAKKRREAEAERQTKMVPGARVMSRAGVFGTLVEFDADDLTTPARVEIADGVVVDMHAQSVDIVPEQLAAADEPVEDEPADEDDTDSSVEVEHEQGTYTVNGEGVEKLPGSDDDQK